MERPDVPSAPESWPETVVLQVDEIGSVPGDGAPRSRSSERPSTGLVSLRRQQAEQSTALTVREVESGASSFAERDPAELDPRLTLLVEPDSQRSASFRLLRDTLLGSHVPRMIAISSGAPNEGKTTCAINLALALAEKPSTRVLLIDANFFEPTLAGIFFIDATTPTAQHINQPWLSPYKVVEVMPGLHVAALVRERGQPAPAFNRRWFDMAIGHLLAAGYDHIILDTAALDGSATVTQVVGAAEGTLLTARAGATTARSLRNAAKQIPKGCGLGVTLMDDETG
jgi:Mrp family chromosome partitioning ATPase